MRSLPIFLRLAEDLKRLTLTASPLYEDPWRLYRLSPWNQLTGAGTDVQNKELVPKSGKNPYQVSMEVGQFKPSELTVKVVDNTVVVEGTYEEQGDGNYVAGHFVRRYTVPNGYDANKVASTLSSDGVLTVTIAKPHISHDVVERNVPIQRIDSAQVNEKEHPKDEKNKKKYEE